MTEERAIVFTGSDDLGDAWFSTRCPKCGRFLSTDGAYVTVSARKGLCGAEGFKCARCGEVEPDFIGFI